MALHLGFQVRGIRWGIIFVIQGQGHTLDQCQRSLSATSKRKICHISVTSPDIKPNNGSTPTFSGTGKPLVPLFLCFKVNVTPWVNGIGYVSHQKVKICHILVRCNHILTIYGSTPRF